jgi:hypothetical protein
MHPEISRRIAAERIADHHAAAARHRLRPRRRPRPARASHGRAEAPLRPAERLAPPTGA